MAFDLRAALELGALGLMALGLLGLLIERIKEGFGIGLRAIQFVAVVFVAPSIFILALEGILSDQTTATLLGTLVGYVLSGLSDNDKGNRPDPGGGGGNGGSGSRKPRNSGGGTRRKQEPFQDLGKDERTPSPAMDESGLVPP